MFVLGMIIIFMFASFIHPKEFRNIIFGLVFFLMIPSTYVFLSLYSLINLNVINWGTREAVAKATGQEVKKEGFMDKVLAKIGAGKENSTLTTLLSSVVKRPKDEDFRELESRLEKTEKILSYLQVSIFTSFQSSLFRTQMVNWFVLL